jgi:GNAT superfamily N-acetyltransferase
MTLALLGRLTQRARDEGYSALRAYVLAINRRAIAMLRRAGFRRRSGMGVLLEYELSLVVIAPLELTPVAGTEICAAGSAGVGRER